jgi:hypothetical protein
MKKATTWWIGFQGRGLAWYYVLYLYQQQHYNNSSLCMGFPISREMTICERSIELTDWMSDEGALSAPCGLIAMSAADDRIYGCGYGWE